jgi:beta-aspartyl-peptidase (threonine type)
VIGVLVHGGAGRIGPERHEAVLAACRAGAAAGLAALASGGRALDAVQAAVRALEDEPDLNAGVGAVLTRDGTVELDAAIMDGTSGRIGAVAAVPDLRRPVDLARAVLDDGEHVMLAGPAAWLFARERGFAPADPAELVTERQRRRLDDERARRAAAATTTGAEPDGGTVGAVAFDASGQVAVATSTGGIAYKRRGRVGDSPLPGCGTWADVAGAASATGDGEAIIRVTLTRQVVDAIAAGSTPAAAARRALDALVARTGGSAGVIVVDRGGSFAAGHAAETMPVALALLDRDGARRAGSWIRPDGLDLMALAAPVP